MNGMYKNKVRVYNKYMIIILNILILFILLGLSLIDIKYRLIPNVYIIAIFFIYPLWVINMPMAPYKFLLLSYLSSFLNLFIISIGGFISKKKLGGGDFKLIGILSLFLVFPYSLIALFISMLSALVYLFIKKEKNLAMGPFISFGFIIFITKKALGI